jgi:hypothetical protein
MARVRTLSAVAALVTGLVIAPAALADAVPPPPRNCPPGTTPVTSHGGPRCEKNAPTNCPAGWQGVLGGTCVLMTCTPGAAGGCNGSLECKPADLCGVERVVDFGWGVSEPAPRGNLLAEPPHKIDPPRHEFHYGDLCNQGRCAQGNTCYQVGVCLPKNVARAGARPANGGTAYGVTPKNAIAAPTTTPAPPATPGPPQPSATAVPVTTETPPPPAGDGGPPTPITEPSATPPPNNAPRGGCSGCNQGSAPGAAIGVTLFALALAFVLKRRAR